MVKLSPYVITNKQTQPSFETGENSIKSRKAKYKDPLNEWPARGLAYTNEFGAAIGEVAPKLGTALWIPALLYFGADIYDKYKNDKIEHKPDMKRGTEQAIFQALASVILPTAAVHGGQKVASQIGKYGKEGITLQAQEDLTSFLERYTSRRNLSTENIDDFKKEFTEQLTNKRENINRQRKFEGPIKSTWNKLFGKTDLGAAAYSNEEKLLKYSDTCIDRIFDINDKLQSNKKHKDIPTKLYRKFQELKGIYKADDDIKISSNYKGKASEDIIKSFEKSRIFKTKAWKTVGGFAALALAVKPIDIFVENVIMKKMISPSLHREKLDENNITHMIKD
ncbi:MAG: hypothetical protein R3Y28_04685 [Candidatus Gastranaerophilales bacterium]